MTAQAGRLREFRMPDVGEGLTEAEILKWYVSVGDHVTDGQVVCEVETAKAAVELPIPYDGVVSEIRFEEGATVDVGTPIIVVDAGGGAEEAAPAAPAPSGEAAAQPAPSGEPEKGGRQAVLVGYGVAPAATARRPRKQQQPPSDQVNGHAAAPAAAAAPAPAPVQVPAPAPAPAVPPPHTGDRPLAKPPVRKLAKDLGIDLATVVPTGPGGVVTREDIRAAAAPPAPLPPVTERAAAPAPAAPAPGVAGAAGARPQEAAGTREAWQARETRIPVKGVRKATAAAMVNSAFTAPHVTEFVTFDMTRTMKLVRELKEDPEFAGLRVSPLLLVAKALLVSVRRHPEVNASWDEAAQEIVRKSYVNLGIAAATPRGLLVPNIKDAQDKTLPELAAALSELVGTAREGKTSPAAMQGGTITITNVGVFGVDTGTPILNPGESAILAFGAVKEQPWVHKGKVKPRWVTTLALSFDHRLVDGELGSKVLADVAAVLEQPRRLMTWV
ncbi:dihydrolipoamide acetyltransferase family protein [Actinacidiphila acididurans]|uniref:Dihydrolipoamide acetyltransferase component of pyruvate dehydrogenase complex n=1 Tax=Actinacidiphila acididurans TaxID=2784346 RepID=A0ABS2TRB8_9ACTN|nr:dihydrolipoamide acetyltransferase family protein [Actinacidiphila acididurans]MBM9505878.1 2-oxo acid dehydrogenase subunit E2 [Actinacidiphila acididurans]